MCSVNEDNYEQSFAASSNEIILLENTVCKKCNENEAFILLRGKDAYCQDCFLTAATHKFRATLGKSKIVRPTDSVLVAHSGKIGSTALLHLIRAGMHESVHKRLVFKTIVLYIDESAVYGHTLEERNSLLKKIENQVKDLGFTGFVTTLNQVFNEANPNVQPLESVNPDIAQDDVLMKSFEDLPDVTAKEDFLCKMRQRLLISAARKLNCNKIFVGDDSTSLAIKILENISLGRAAHLSLDVGFTDTRHADVMLLRPMRDFTKKELSYYISHFKLQIISFNNLTTKKQTCFSIKKMTEKFIMDLDSEFCSTVSTVFRIGEKLSSKTEKSQSLENICILCQARLDTCTSSAEVSAIQATSFSQMISLSGPNKACSSNTCDDQASNLEHVKNNCHSEYKKNCCSKNNKVNITLNDILSCLCYGCRLIFRDLPNMNNVPCFIKKAAVQVLSLEKMRLEINDFLL